MIHSSAGYSILFMTGTDAVKLNGSIKVNLTLQSNEFAANTRWKWIRYTIDNERTNPFRIWTQHNCSAFPSDQLFASMRDREVSNLNYHYNLHCKTYFRVLI